MLLFRHAARFIVPGVGDHAVSTKPFSKVQFRVTDDVWRALEREQAETGARSVSAVVQARLEAVIDRAAFLEIKAQPALHDSQALEKNMSLRTPLVEELRRIAQLRGTNIGHLVNTMLVGGRTLSAPAPTRPLRLFAPSAQAA